MSLFLSFRHHADVQDTSEHWCSLVSCVSLPCYLWMPRARASTLVLARVLISLFSTPCRCTVHERAPVLARVLCVLTLLSLDSQSTDEHIGAHLCPYFSLFNTMQMHSTQASTFVLACVLSVSLAPCRQTGHE